MFYPLKSYVKMIYLGLLFKASLFGVLSEDEAKKKLETIHESLKLVHGSLQDEYPEQVMATMFVSADAKVLELGGNVGRNSCVIASLLNNQKNLIVMEPETNNALLLQDNRDANNLKFRVEIAAVSRTPLVFYGWSSQPSDVDIPGWIRIRTTTFQELEHKYDITFDTLVADCEGALYYILKDDDTILDKMRTLIVENDYTNQEHYFYVKKKFEEKGFTLAYNKAGGWEPCYNCFFQVWTK